MREEVIVHVKHEVHSEDEEEIDPSTIPQSSSAGMTAEVSANTPLLNLEDSSSSQQDWPCAVCGRVFHQREEVLDHTRNEHAQQLFQDILLDEGIRAKMAAFQQQQRLLALLQNSPAAAVSLMQQPAAAAAMLQLLQSMGGVGVKNDVPLLPSFPVPSRKVMRVEKPSSPYESRRGSFPGRPRHPVWSLFLRIDKFDAECTLCKSRVRSACPTNLCRHLNNNHCELASQLFVKWKKQKEDLGGSFPPLEPRANRHKSSSTSSTSSSISCSSIPAAAAAPMAPPVTSPSLPGFPHLNLVLQQQQLLLKQREQSSTLSPEVLQAIDVQLIVNSKIIGQAQKALETHNLSAAAAVAARIQSEAVAGPSREGVIHYGRSERRSSEESADEAEESAIDIDSLSTNLDVFISSSKTAVRRSSSAPPPSYCSSRPSSAARPASAPPMIALMDGNTFEMYAYQDLQQAQQQMNLLQMSQGEAAAAIRQPPQTLENWFTTAYAQPLHLEASAVMNAGAYGTLAPPTDAVGIAATVAESASFDTEKNMNLFTEEQQQLFAASSSTEQQQLQLIQTVKQEIEDMGDESSSSLRPSIFQSTPTSSLMNQLLPGQPPAKRGRPTENPCWDHFVRLDDTLVKCRTCEKVVKSACATNMTKHLERHHTAEYQILLEKIRYSKQFKPNPPTSTTPATSSTQQQFPSSTMALNHIVHQPQHHLLQPMASDLGQQLSHHLPLSPDPSPAAPHCFLSTQHHLLKDPSSLRPEMLLIPTSDGLIPNIDPNSYHIPSDFYQNMQFDNSLFDSSQWQTRHFTPSSGYDQWMGTDQSSSAMLMPDEWSQSAATAAAVQQQQQQQQQIQQQQAQLQQLQLQQNSVIQSVVAGATTSADVLDAAALAAAAAVVASDASSTSSTSSSTCGGNVATTSLNGMMRNHESKPYMKRNRKTEHPVWEFFKRTADGNAQCGICNGIVKSPCSSNFMRHLMRHHSVEYNAVYAKWSMKRGPPVKSTSASF